MNPLVLKKGREKSLQRRHPWIFSGAVEKAAATAGRNASKCATPRARCWRTRAYSPKSQIRARVWTFDPAEAVDAAFFRNRIQKALALREALPAAKHTNALRLVQRRIRRPAGAGGRPLRRRAGGAVPRRRRRALARPDPGCADGDFRLRSDLRALGRRGAQARRPGAARRLRARQPQRLALPDHRVRPQFPRRRRAGAEDRLLPRPAREPPARARARRRARGARRLLLHRRLLDRRARRRREARHRDRELRAGARSGEGEPGRQSARRLARCEFVQADVFSAAEDLARSRTRSSTSSSSIRRSSRRPPRR